ncbi:triose-phosphate isomerase [Clostridium sp. 'deep sea']|uniref:triose-phosphate isomerase n=1 Tax=Clostridium sp. 'deep sea' TaxID=2779445 RepID=UPI001896924A|nr:triose-phosphate isomerase [Clostridium sp. 'deep sea']QOR34468.1 triose-phosphate isomerase [Clostridium sp. 'deep sea']
MRKPIIAGNHKMNLTPAQTESLLKELKNNIANYGQVEIIICPPFTSLAIAKITTENTNIQLGAQNVHQAEKGAFTGEISAPMLKEIGCDWIICGHSERRHIYQESNEIVNNKIKATLNAGLKPILCVGETSEEREQHKTNEVLQNQLKGSLAGLTEAQLQTLVVAYEPVWAIGTGKTATPNDANTGCSFIREQIANMYGKKLAENTRILYGGSVKPANVKQLMSEIDIDGALVGGASLKSADFTAIVKFNE